MARYTLHQTIDKIKAIANDHAQINSVGYGELSDVDATKGYTMPLCWVVEQPSNISGRILINSVMIIVMDLVHKDLSNALEVVSNTQQILTDIIAEMQSPENQALFEVGTDGVSLTPFQDRFDDEVSGWYCTLNIETSYLQDRCAVPNK